jgi:hypothetical protein
MLLAVPDLWSLLPIVLPIVAIQLTLVVVALRDLLRPERRVRGGSKLAWGLVIVFISLLGPILYFTAGRENE